MQFFVAFIITRRRGGAKDNGEVAQISMLNIADDEWHWGQFNQILTTDVTTW